MAARPSPPIAAGKYGGVLEGDPHSAQMKVCFLTAEFPPMRGGVGDYTAMLAQSLQSLGAESEVLTHHRWKAKAADDTRICNEEAGIFALIRDWDYRCWWDVDHWLRESQPDILHIQFQTAAFDLKGWINWLPWYLKHKQCRSHIVTTFHDLREPYIFPKAGKFRWKSILSLGLWSDAVIVTNLEDYDILQKELKGKKIISGQSKEAKITIIPLGNNIMPYPQENNERERLRQQFGADEQSIVIGYFGLLNASKGGEELVEVLAQLISAGYNALLLIIGGEAGDADPNNRCYSRSLRRLIQQRNLAKKVIITGFKEPREVSALLQATDVMLMPYRDGASFRRTTLIAALQHALPIISTEPKMQIKEIINGSTMLLVPQRDVKKMAEAVLQVIRDDELRKRLAKGAKELGDAFDWERISQKTYELYASIAGHD